MAVIVAVVVEARGSDSGGGSAAASVAAAAAAAAASATAACLYWKCNSLPLQENIPAALAVPPWQRARTSLGLLSRVKAPSACRIVFHTFRCAGAGFGVQMYGACKTARY